MLPEAHEIPMQSGRPAEAAEIVLAGGKDHGSGRHDLAAVEARLPSAIRPGQRHDTTAAPDIRATIAGAPQDRLVQDAARQADGRERQLALDDVVPGGQPDAGDRRGAQRRDIDAELLEGELRLRRQELAADLVVRPALALDERDLPAGAREVRRRGSAREPAPDDQDLAAHAARIRETETRNGTCHATSIGS